MPRLVVCPLRHLPRVLAGSGATHLVSLLTPPATVARPASIAAERHLELRVSDIAEARDGHVLAGAADIERLLDFASRWDRAAPLLIHCHAGVSRSTAAAFVIAAALSPERDEQEIARALRAASPTATPNPRLVTLGDAILKRSGRMEAAIAAIGRGAECFEGAPFSLALALAPTVRA